MNTRIFIIFSLYSFLLIACVTSPQTHYYILESQYPVSFQLDRKLPAGTGGKRIQLRSLSIPDYLSRLQIVTRSDNGSLNIDDYHQWAEPLDATIRRVLIEDLSIQLAPWQIYDSVNMLSANEADYDVDIQVFNFEKKPNDSLYFKALVTISDRNKHMLLSEVNEMNLPVAATGQDYNALVAAMNQCLANFAGKLAGYFQTIESVSR